MPTKSRSAVITTLALATCSARRPSFIPSASKNPSVELDRLEARDHDSPPPSRRPLRFNAAKAVCVKGDIAGSVVNGFQLHHFHSSRYSPHQNFFTD